MLIWCIQSCSFLHCNCVYFLLPNNIGTLWKLTKITKRKTRRPYLVWVLFVDRSMKLQWLKPIGWSLGKIMNICRTIVKHLPQYIRHIFQVMNPSTITHQHNMYYLFYKQYETNIWSAKRYMGIQTQFVKFMLSGIVSAINVDA